MSSPSLPKHAEDIWDCGFVLNPPTDVRAVSSRGGLVIAGGDQIYMLRPGAQRMATRELPLDIGPIRVAAAEPRAPFRYAVASEEMVAIFVKTKEGDQIVRLRPSEPGSMATHLAWAMTGGVLTLFIRWDDGTILRANPDMRGGDTIDVPPMDAIASDEAGVLALLSFDPDEPRVFVTKDGEHLSYRALPYPLEMDFVEGVHLAVADTAVAFAIARGGAFLSRAGGELFVPCAPLAGAGPLAFEGHSSDAALFGAAQGPSFSSILRVDRSGAAMAIAELGNDAGVSPALVGLSWDSSRRTLWAASPEVGIFSCTAPSAKGKKKVQLS